VRQPTRHNRLAERASRRSADCFRAALSAQGCRQHDGTVTWASVARQLFSRRCEQVKATLIAPHRTTAACHGRTTARSLLADVPASALPNCPKGDVPIRRRTEPNDGLDRPRRPRCVTEPRRNFGRADARGDNHPGFAPIRALPTSSNPQTGRCRLLSHGQVPGAPNRQSGCRYTPTLRPSS
jgi:hypothetical protein